MTASCIVEQVSRLERFFVRRDVHGLEDADGYQHTSRDKLSRTQLNAHLRGGIRLGAHTVAIDDTVRWACIDVDKDTLPAGISGKAAGRNVVRRLKAENFSCLVERSKSRGYHVWVFFNRPVHAWKVRLCLQTLTKDAGLPKLEVFP
jgi:hypothetical protein